MYYGFYGGTYILVIIGALLTMFASWNVSHTYKKYARVRASCQMSGSETVAYILRRNSISDVNIGRVSGNLSDHYSPGKHIVNLSDATYSNRSVAAICVAAHECGHVMQHKEGYAPLKIRNALAPAANFGSNAGIWIVMLSIFFGLSNLFLDLGILLFLSGVLFQIITLPVEFDASKRALIMLDQYGILSPDENRKAKKVLKAAALTYVAAAASSILQLLRLVLIRSRRSR